MTKHSSRSTGKPRDEYAMRPLGAVTRQPRSPVMHTIPLLAQYALNEGIVVLDASGAVHHYNAAAERILGVKAADLPTLLLRKPVWLSDHGGGGELSPAQCPVIAAFATGEPQLGKIMALSQEGGSVRQLSVSATPIANGRRKPPASVVVSFVDLDAQNDASEALREIIEAGPDGFVVFDPDDRLVICNEAYRQIHPSAASVIRPGASFEEILRFGLEQQQYPEAGVTDTERTAWLAERIKRHHAPTANALQQLPDGRWQQICERRTARGFSVGFRTDVSQLKQETAKLRAVIEAFPGGIALYDAEFAMLSCNQKLRSLFALPDQMFERGLPSLEDVLRSVAVRGEYGPGDPEEHVRVRLARFKSGAHSFAMHRPDGRVFEIKTTGVDGGGLLVTHLDETARYEAQRRLQDSERNARETAAILQSTLAHMSQGLAMFDGNGRLLAWNDLFPAIYGFPPELMRRGTTIKAIMECRKANGNLDEDADEFIARIRGDIAVTGVSTTRSRMADGRVISVINTLVEGGGWVSTHEDITAREQAERQIAHLVYHDSLTGLLNRMGFRKRGEATLAQARSRSELASIVLVDLDRFKAINDAHGHKAGDRLLISVADRLRANLRANDIVARLGGDEFAILLHDSANLAEPAAALSSRLVDVLGAPYYLDGFTTTIGASVGIASSFAADETIERLMHKADLALYEVKARGRNAYCVYQDELGNRAEERRTIEHDLREALAQSALELYYQPIVSLADESISGMEALIRWRHPIRGMMPPDSFIPIAEDSGLILPLSQFVIKQACLDAAEWPAHINVSINVSPAHLRKGGVAKMVMEACEQARIPPTRLVIEVTETVLLQDDGGMLSELEQLKNIGVSIALDDFGTGFSSLSYLRMFAFDKIKIDKSFVSEMTTRADSAAIVGAVAGLARSLDMMTTAEGVETRDQLGMVKAAGCVQGQGYFFGKPQPISAYLQAFAAAG